MERQREPTHKRLWLGTVRRVWPIARQVLGWLLIILGLVGLVLPFLQGILFLVLGIALVGRRNWLLRRAALLIKRGLRRWARHPSPLVGHTGRAALRAQHHFSRQSRHMHRRFAERGRQSPRQLPTADYRLTTDTMDNAVHHTTQADTQ